MLSAAALAAPPPRKLYFGRGVDPSLPCPVSVALRPQPPHPPFPQYAVAHRAAPVPERAPLLGGHRPMVTLEGLLHPSVAHLDGDQRLVGAVVAAHQQYLGAAARTCR